MTVDFLFDLPQFGQHRLSEFPFDPKDLDFGLTDRVLDASTLRIPFRDLTNYVLALPHGSHQLGFR
ncbi:hypothetical protein [Roseibium sp. M-1]